jgi:glycosyltransferase involved in cell wall biosynthesis
MKYVVVIPAYNEEAYIEKTLTSLASQTKLPAEVIVVNDNSTDCTEQIVQNFANNHNWIKVITKQSENIHLPGSKVIEAADLILPDNYFEAIIAVFIQDPQTGMAGGFAYVEKNGRWILENLTDKNHIRGAFKAYRKVCFEQIGGLRSAMGWDTVDELLCRYYSWKVVTIEDLKVKHLKPTGALYDQKARYKQGEAFYRLHYGFVITLIAALKLAFKKKKPLLCMDYLTGFFKAKKERKPFLVNKEQGRYIRHYRWKKIISKLT